MALTQLSTNLAIIAALSDLPNATDGLTAAQLKAKFDEGPTAIKTYLNSTLLTELGSTTAGDSGLYNIGMSTINGYTNPQLFLQYLYDTVGGISPSPQSLDRQAIINGNFEVWQRGVSSTGTGFIADRWRVAQSADSGTLPTLTHARLSLAGGEVAQSAYAYWITNDGPGTSLGAGSHGILEQPIENGARALCGSGKKVTVSFWARSDISGKRIGVYAAQTYGTGGSPSAGEIINGTNFTLTATWTQYTYTFDTTTLSGKTFGTNNDDTFNISFMYSWGSSLQARVGASTAETFGVAGNTYFAQVQVCAGEVALPFHPRSYGEELELSRRYFQKRSTNSVSQYDLSPTMRVNPTITGGVSPYSYDAEF